MKISYNWLKEFITTDKSPQEIGALLTQTGLEVEHISAIQLYKGEIFSGSLEGLVIGEVFTCMPHPNADKLSLTTVNLGDGKIVPIVCGAPNVAAGQKVVVAQVGTTLYPTNSTEPLFIKKAKIKGEVSEGMICAKDEIGLGINHEGILVLDTQLPNGTPATEYFHLETDYTIEIGLTPNRVDAASHLGVARDLRAVLDQPLKEPYLVHDWPAPNTIALPISIKVENKEAAPRYAGVCISGVKVESSPVWLQNRLRAIGLTPINNIVDITNFVLHELGQPLHAFDYDKITGKQVIVKNLPEGTPFVTLEGKERKLVSTDLMICNTEGPMCIAGVFGGLESGVTASTQNIFLESAYFNASSIRKTSQYHGLKTDASFRFERGTDPNMPIIALKRAVSLILEIAGGQIASDIIDTHPDPFSNFKIEVSYQQIARLIGKTIENETIHKILGNLDIEILEDNGKRMLLGVPAYRVDVQREADVIEEILRIYGFNQVEITDHLASSFLASFPASDPHQLQNKITSLLAAKGLSEIMTNSLTTSRYSEVLKNIDQQQDVKILNKLSEDLDVLRQSLVFSGLEVIAHNLNRKQKDLKLFEFGKIYKNIENQYQESKQLAIFYAGNIQSENWRQGAQKVDFHEVATITENVLKAMRQRQWQTSPVEAGIFAYGLQYSFQQKTVAQAGLLQSYILKEADIKTPVWYAELDWDWLLRNYTEALTYQEIPKFPEVRRDLSIVVDKSVTYQEIEKVAFQTEKNLLKAMNVFSVYEGEQLGEGKKSYAVSFILQDLHQTLTDKQIETAMQKLMQQFTKQFGAFIRE